MYTQIGGWILSSSGSHPPVFTVVWELWAADIGNAYLEATTKEKLFIVAGPEFEVLQGY